MARGSVEGPPRGRFGKDARVRKRSEYRRIQSDGHRVSLPHFVFVLTTRPDGAGGRARLGITASRKVGGAVVRNRSKRLVRAAFRALGELFPSDVDVVVIVKSAPPAQTLWDVIDEWRTAAPHVRRRAEQARARRQG